MPTAIRMMGGSAYRTQRISVNGASNYSLLSDSAFLNLHDHRPIVVTFIGTYTAPNVGAYAVTIGDLSAYAQVRLIISGSIRGDGGNGGVGASGGTSGTSSGSVAGGPGGAALNIASGNVSSRLSLVNNGTIYGAGGAGGGGGRGSNSYKNSKACTSSTTFYAGGGGGGGAQGGIATGGGARGPGSHTVNPAAGSAGGSGGAGNGGARGQMNEQDHSECFSTVKIAYGGAGGAGGAYGVAGVTGAVGGSAGGAAGNWIDGSSRIDIVTQGTTAGGTG